MPGTNGGERESRLSLFCPGAFGAGGPLQGWAAGNHTERPEKVTKEMFRKLWFPMGERRKEGGDCLRYLRRNPGQKWGSQLWQPTFRGGCWDWTCGHVGRAHWRLAPEQGPVGGSEPC